MMQKKYKKSEMPLKTYIIAFLIIIFLFPSISFSQEKLDKRSVQKAFKTHLKEGKSHYRKKAYVEAIRVFLKAQQLKPRNKAVERLIKKAKKKLMKKVPRPAEQKYSEVKIAETEKKRTLSLEECIGIAVENDLSLKRGKLQLKLAQFRLLEAKRKLGPTLTAKWEESTGKVSALYYEGTKISIEGKQPLFYGGELVFSVKQAKVNLEIVKTDFARIKNELILQVKKAYYSLDKAKEALELQKKLHARTKELYDIVKTGYGVEVIPRIEFLKVASQYNQVNFQVISAEEDLSLANLLLQQAMNITEPVEIEPLEEPKVIALELEDCFNLAYLNRPEIKISQLSLDYFEYEKKIAKARTNWPRVDFLGSYGNTKEDFLKRDMGFERDPRRLGPEYYFGTKVSLPIWGSTLGYSLLKEKWQPVVQTTKGTESRTHTTTFSILDKMEDLSDVEESELEYMKSLEEMNKKEQELTLEVKEMFFKYRKAVILMDVAKSKVEFQSKQVEILDIRRQLGEAQHSDVVEEMIKLAEEEFSYRQAIADYYISIAELNKAIGIDGYFKAT